MTAPIPSTTFSFPNNGLGLTPPSPAGVFAILGASSTGTAATPSLPIGGKATNVSDQFGLGPMPHLAANLVQSGATVICVKVASTNGTPGAVTKTGAGVSVMSVTGTGFDQYDVIVTVTKGGTVGTDTTCAVTVSFDGGATTSREYVIPISGTLASFATLTGLTFAFTTATVIAGNTYTFSVPAPTVSAANVVTALTALKNSTRQFSMVYVCGAFAASAASTITDQFATFPAAKRFSRLILEAVDQSSQTEAAWMTALAGDFATFNSDLVGVAASYFQVRDILTGWKPWRSLGYLVAVRAALVAVHRDLAAVEDGPLVPYKDATPVDSTVAVSGRFVHDERLTQGLNSARFMTAQSLAGLENEGYFLTNPNMMSGPTSDYDLLQFGRIADETARLTNIYFTRKLSSDVTVTRGTGFILETEAQSLEKGNNAACYSLVSGKSVSDLQTVVSRTDNILVNRTTTVTVKIQPKGYMKSIPITIAFSATAA